MLRSASRSAAQQGGPPAEPQPPERQKEALKVMGKLRATNHSGKRGAGCAHSTKDLEQDEEPSSAQQRAAKKKVRTSSKRYKGVKRGASAVVDAHPADEVRIRRRPSPSLHSHSWEVLVSTTRVLVEDLRFNTLHSKCPIMTVDREFI